MMYEVWAGEYTQLTECQTLDEAMKFAKDLDMFVVIRGPDMEVAGVFGVAPPPADYEWSKDYSLGKRKSKKEWNRDETKTDR